MSMFLLTLAPFCSAAISQQCMRENKEKQALGDLMIKPVQRIPRYELLVKVSRVSALRRSVRLYIT